MSDTSLKKALVVTLCAMASASIERLAVTGEIEFGSLLAGSKLADLSSSGIELVSTLKCTNTQKVTGSFREFATGTRSGEIKSKSSLNSKKATRAVGGDQADSWVGNGTRACARRISNGELVASLDREGRSRLTKEKNQHVSIHGSGGRGLEC